MHQRADIRNVPNRDPYISATVPGGEVVHLRVPSHLRAMTLLRAVPAEVLAALDSLDTSPGAILASARDAGPEVLSLLGALVGLSWYHQTSDLDVPELTDDARALAYGRQVYEELHDAGYSLSTVLLLGVVVLQEVVQRAALEREVQERIAFFGRRPERPSASE